jgi:hypothetical protein
MKPRALFICGSVNQTEQLRKIAAELPEFEARFTPYYGDRHVELLRQTGLLESTIGGNKLRERCLGHLRRAGLRLDLEGRAGGYELVVTCSDLTVPENTRGARLVAVQEGILDRPTLLFGAVKRWGVLPRWLGGTAATGLSGRYDRFCVASDGYRDYFARQGAPRERLVVTGIPNFDDCAQYLRQPFAHRGYVLVCTSDARETLKRDDRDRFLSRVVGIAQGRPLIFKLHPNEQPARALAEIARHAPRARVYTEGSAEVMVAHCDELVTQWSSLAFVGLALGKPTHSHHDVAELRRLLPLQHRRAARHIADVCRELCGIEPLALPHAHLEAAE